MDNKAIGARYSGRAHLEAPEVMMAPLESLGLEI
jgi:hypothetical protein